MNSPVVKIKERLSIEEVVSSYIKLDRVGTNLKARCPFHNEKTPSFFISTDRGTYYCFGCGASGDIFTFVEEFEGLDFKGALKLLADRAGVPLEAYTPQMKEAESEKEKLYRVMEEATLYFKNNLKENKEVLGYLTSRGIQEKTIKDFRIGFARLDWRLLYDYLKSKSFTDVEIERAGLAKKPEDKNKAMYDRFRGRIMFPIADSSGRVVAFSGRIFVDDGKSAKYLNSPETPIFSKSAILYGIDKAKSAIKKFDFSIVVEGQFDLILSHQAGYKNTVATSGTSLTQEDSIDGRKLNSFGMISRLSNNIIFVFDYDKAGFSASVRAAKIALDLDMNVKAIEMPEGMDPADVILKKGENAWKEAIKTAKYLIQFLFEKYIPKSEKADSLTKKLEISKNIIPVLNHIKNPITRAHFLSYISDKSGISEDNIKDIANSKLENNQESVVNIGNSSRMYRKDYIERKLLGIAFWQQTLSTPVVDFEIIFKKLGEIVKKYESLKQDLMFEAEVFYVNNENLEKSVKEMFLNLEEENINEELSRKMLQLKQTSDEEQGKNILQEINELNKKKEDIKNGRLSNSAAL